MGGGGCVGMAVEVLGVGLFASPVERGKWDDARRRRMKHRLIVNF